MPHSHNGEISVFNNYFDPKPIMTGDIITYLNNVKNGLWKEEVIQARDSGKGSKVYDSIKTQLTAVTVSGVFEPKRLDENLKSHSGFICMDFDHLPNVDELKLRLHNDEHTFAVFKSISGLGLAVFVKISKPEKHRDYFAVMREYYREKYQVEADPKCINVSRLRGASYDQECFVNTESSVWSKLTGLKKAQKPKPSENIIATKTDFNALINEIVGKSIDVTNGYENWLSCGFAIAEEFGESGREYYHSISQVNADYDSQSCDKQYDHCLKSDNGSKITIGTFYYFCKLQGLDISSRLTREAVSIVSIKKSSEQGKEEAKQAIEHLELSEEDIDYIIEEVYSNPVNRQFKESLPLAERVELYITNTYDIRINELGRFIEIEGKPMENRKPNQIWLECMKFIDEKTPQHLVRAAFDSDKIPDYNPIKAFFDRNNDKYDSDGHIDKIADSIPSCTRVGDLTSMEYKRLYLKKWLVGMVAGIYGSPNPLVLALVGTKTDTGKTEFFRRLLPPELQRFQDEATLDNSNDRDNIIKLVKNILIFDDEGASRNYKESQKFKSLTSKNRIKIRKLHTSIEEEFLRIATLGLTSNETDVIKEDTNRRIVPIEVIDKMDHDLFNSVDKTAMIMEAYRLYKSGFKFIIGRNEIEAFNNSLSNHMEEDIYIDSISLEISPGDYAVPTAHIMQYVTYKYAFMRNNAMFFGKKMRLAGFERVRRINNGQRHWCYLVSKESCDRMSSFFNYDVNIVVEEKKPLNHESKVVNMSQISLPYKDSDDLPF